VAQAAVRREARAVAALEAGPPELPQGERRRRWFVFIV